MPFSSNFSVKVELGATTSLPSFPRLTIAEEPSGVTIVLDVKMPGIDGWETCTRIKSHPVTADIPVILLTGCDDIDLSQHATAVGASAVLSKPCPPERLTAQIAAALGPRFSSPVR